MCGISGIFDLRGKRNVDQPLLKAMNRSQAHRGPDGEGYHFEPGVGLGHRRLAIIDLEGGAQPMFNEDDSVAVTFNGEIYNFMEVCDLLRARGHVFRTRCDTEVIVHAWEEWGEACVERFNGMFAFAIWDRNKDCLFLARDRIGIKPLYYGVSEDGLLLFGTELKVLMCHPRFSRQIRDEAVEDYFAFGYVPDPKTIFRNAFKLPPGHTLRIERRETLPVPRRYWDVPFAPAVAADGDVLDAELIERLKGAVNRRLIAEVPLGAFLSGGVDSSAVVAMMGQLSDDPVNTCCISFGDPAFNESQFAQQVADRYRTRHHVSEVDPDDFSLVEKLPYFYDEPFADSSAMPTYRVCELARQRVTVALSGDGGDENFIGYRRYRWHAYEERVRRILPQAVRGSVFGALGRIYPKLDRAPKIFRAKSTLEAIARDSLEGYLHSVSIFPTVLRERLYSSDFLQQLRDYRAIEVFREHADNAPIRDGLPLIQYLDYKTYLPGDILTKVDRASMAHSLEVRVPILDHTFVEWVSGIPADKKLVGRDGKHCFKRALGPYVPHDVMYREKMGFGVPISKWFRGALRERLRESVLGGALGDSGYFKRSELERLVNEHQSGAREHSAILWALMMFEGSLSGIACAAESATGVETMTA
jgi:asparagine synthase (glutamine-hydrolysing)